MPDTEFGCLATAIGSMPQDDAEAACTQVVKHLKNIPAYLGCRPAAGSGKLGNPGSLLNSEALDPAPKPPRNYETYM